MLPVGAAHRPQTALPVCCTSCGRDLRSHRVADVFRHEPRGALGVSFSAGELVCLGCFEAMSDSSREGWMSLADALDALDA